jgi:hypothetical protein
MVLITKRFFYPLFKRAFATAFTQKNIESAFLKTGIWLYNPKQVLRKIRKPIPQPELMIGAKVLRTPKTCYDVCQV